MSTHLIKSLISAVKPDVIDDNEDGVKWAEKALKHIAKRCVKDRSLELLELAVRQEDKNTACILVKATPEEKKRSAMDKGCTHVLSCRLFRFSWLRSINDIRTLASCPNGFSRRAQQYCINPFHYDVAHGPKLPSIIVERNRFEWPKNGLRDPEIDEYIPNETLSPDAPQLIRRDIDDLYRIGSPNSILSDDVDMESLQDDEIQSIVPTIHGNTIEKVSFEEGDSWLKVTYFEGPFSRGNSLQIKRSYILIDGFNCPTNAERFSVGYLTGYARERKIEETRRLIGRGVRLYYIGGEIYCECLSDHPIFIQAPSCSKRHGWALSTVCKVPPRCNIKLWNNGEFAVELASAVERGYEAVYALTRLCTIRISFVKGWGSDYHRQDVTSTSCWIIAHLPGPMQWIDRVLASMGAPPQFCTSVT